MSITDGRWLIWVINTPFDIAFILLCWIAGEYHHTQQGDWSVYKTAIGGIVLFQTHEIDSERKSIACLDA